MRENAAREHGRQERLEKCFEDVYQRALEFADPAEALASRSSVPVVRCSPPASVAVPAGNFADETGEESVGLGLDRSHASETTEATPRIPRLQPSAKSVPFSLAVVFLFLFLVCACACFFFLSFFFFFFFRHVLI